ncbi:MAG: snoRNA-binding protein [Trizodia sp. TS-e1964]|nr:MAG: snoRNA-binding protein [Trizodia sp. TS-e1964]
MAKEKLEKSKDRSERKAAKRSEKDGIHKTKKDKKSKKPVESIEEIITAPTVEEIIPAQVKSIEEKVAPPIGALVPFAKPLAGEKASKKVLKAVKKAAKNKSLKRGVKEVVKCLRKSSTNASVPGVVILAADISPPDVISHLPVLCEDHNVPYLFVTSRAELGAAGSTKRPTSVVMVTPEGMGKKKGGEVADANADFMETFKDLVRLVEKESVSVKI